MGKDIPHTVWNIVLATLYQSQLLIEISLCSNKNAYHERRKGKGHYTRTELR